MAPVNFQPWVMPTTRSCPPMPIS
jgi:hypothetical protein